MGGDNDGQKSADSKRLAQAGKHIRREGSALGCGKLSPSTGDHTGV